MTVEMKQTTARWAGLLYLVSVITGVFSLMVVPAQIHMHGDVAMTIEKFRAHEGLFRLGIAAGAIDYIVFAILPLLLYQLLASVNKPLAILMVVLALISIPLDFIAIAHQLDLLSLLEAGKSAPLLAPNPLQAQALLLIHAYDNVIMVAQIFWGLWLLPFGALVFKSGWLPKTLGVLLILGGIGYLVTFFSQTLFPQHDLPDLIMLPAAMGEIGICLWLLIVGPRRTLLAPSRQSMA